MKYGLAICAMWALWTLLPAKAQADTGEVEAITTFESGVDIQKVDDMLFGVIDTSGAPAGGSTVTMGTNGNINSAGVFTGAATGTPGSVEILAGDNGVPVDVFCDTTATLSDGIASTINIVDIRVTASNALAGPGAGPTCNGLAGAAATSLLLDIGTLDTFVFGGQIDGGTALGFTPGPHSTTNPGGDPLNVEIRYQ